MELDAVSMKVKVAGKIITISSRAVNQIDRELAHLKTLLESGKTDIYYTTGIQAHDAHDHVFHLSGGHGSIGIETFHKGKATLLPVYFSARDQKDLLSSMKDALLAYHQTRWLKGAKVFPRFKSFC